MLLRDENVYQTGLNFRPYGSTIVDRGELREREGREGRTVSDIRDVEASSHDEHVLSITVINSMSDDYGHYGHDTSCDTMVINRFILAAFVCMLLLFIICLTVINIF